MQIALEHDASRHMYSVLGSEDKDRNFLEWRTSIEPLSDRYRRSSSVAGVRFSVRSLTVSICDYNEEEKVSQSCLCRKKQGRVIIGKMQGMISCQTLHLP